MVNKDLVFSAYITKYHRCNLDLLLLEKLLRVVDSRTHNHKSARSNAVFNAYTIYGAETTDFTSSVRSMR